MIPENARMASWIHSIVLVMFICCVPVWTHAQGQESNERFGTTRIKKDKVALHYKMSRNSPVVKILKRGDSVVIELKIHDEDGQWCGIREKGKTEISGFVLCEYIEEKEFFPEKVKQPDELIKDMPELIRAAGQGDIGTLRELIEKGANINTRDRESGWTALMAASLSGRVDIVQLLLEKGANVDERDKFSWTPLMIASRSGHTDIVRILLDAGANVNAKTKTGYTALMTAAKQGQTDVVKLLLIGGADVCSRDQFGWRAITLAERNGHSDIAEMLKKAEERE